MSRWAPITESDPTVCGRPQEYDASKEWKNKKVVLFSVPGMPFPILYTRQRVDSDATGAFTPGCQARHLPPYIEKVSEFKNKGVDVIAVIASNDSFVMHAWGKVNGVKGDDIVCAPWYYLGIKLMQCSYSSAIPRPSSPVNMDGRPAWVTASRCNVSTIRILEF